MQRVRSRNYNQPSEHDHDDDCRIHRSLPDGRDQHDLSWLVSNWSAGQTNIMDWSSNNVRVGMDGAVEFVLDNAPSGTTDPFLGGEIQSNTVATTGT